MPAAPSPTAPPVYFTNAAAFRRWLAKHHRSATELWMGYFKKASGRPSITYQEALDEALCYGWIDGIVRTIDDERYMQRWTPRKPTSIWSNVNVAKVEALTKAGRMKPAGKAAYARRTADRTGVYGFERADEPVFSAEALRAFKAMRGAWKFFAAQPPGYRRTCTHYVTSAKRQETRDRRLAELIDHSARGERLPRFESRPRPK